MIEPGSPTDEQPATTAGEQSHEDITVFVGDEADAPQDTGQPDDKEGDA
ncbi:hypothetical protein SAMN05421810_10165 [Amycolatopsis arida]|uniref:Uncharacterized protein n=1 Tax=Amycolatopsis arida TaxID=587909 RepID=A0A1I5KBB6_9PSEU|nr:hypothetical protein [Amycolatopsis arida]TDX96961.1 hypothetical protein CLV69_10263 [Amycolatopsis arida]SFO82033.1 hypothetical protein SAMN05421810_10165 [Amycolatopsis arida]